MKLEGKVAIVTGPGKAGKGIGRAIAVALGHEGADIVVAGSTLENAELVANAVRNETGRKAIASSGLETLTGVRADDRDYRAARWC